MKLWIMSDLHCELTSGWDIPGPGERPDHDVAIMAGDLMPRMERGVEWLLERFPDKPVIYIPGNHEFYGTDLEKTLAKAREAARGTNIFVFENDSLEIQGVQFIGCCLWTDFALFGNVEASMRTAGETMNDYRRIRHLNYTRRLRPLDTLARHQQSRAFIKQQLSTPHAGKRVVISHHPPWPGGLRNGTDNDPVSAAYSSSGALIELIVDGKPDVWAYGHTHRSDDSILGTTRMISNSKGYGPDQRLGKRTWDNPMFDPKFVVEI